MEKLRALLASLDLMEVVTKIDPVVAAKIVRICGADASVRARVNVLYPWIKSFGLALGVESVVSDDKVRKDGPP